MDGTSTKRHRRFVAVVPVMWALLVACVHGVDYPAVTSGGSCTNDAVCPCEKAVLTNASRLAAKVYLAFRGEGNPLPPHSAFKRPSHRSSAGSLESVPVLSGVAMRPIVLEFLRQPTNLSASTCPSYSSTNLDTLYPGTSWMDPIPHPLASFNESVFIRRDTIRLVADDPSAVSWSFSMNYSAAVRGVIVLYNFTVWAPASTELYFVFNTSVGLWTLSPFLTIQTSLATSALHLELIETGNNWISLLPCFATPLVTEGKPFLVGPADLTFAVENAGGYINYTLDGKRLLINASLQDAQSGTLVVDTHGNNFVVRSGKVSAASGMLTVNWVRPSTSSGSETEPIPDLPFQFVFSVAGGDAVAYSSWMLLTATSTPSFGITFAPSSYLQGTRPLSVYVEHNTSSAASLALADAAAVVGVPLRRVVINVVTSTRHRDYDSPNGFVVAACDGAVLSGNFAAVRGGVTVFEALTITNLDPPTTSQSQQRSVIITFSAEPSSGVFFPRPLFSEPILVTTTANAGTAQSFLRLRSYSNSLRPSDSASQSLILPRVGQPSRPVAVDVVGVNGLVDPAAEDCSRVTMSSAMLLLNSITVSPVAGTALFPTVDWSAAVTSATSSLVYASLQFACASAGGAASPTVAPLIVSPILLASNNSAVASIQFQPSALNLLSHTYQDTFAVGGVALPPVVVEVLRTDATLAANVSDMLVYAVAGDGDGVEIVGAQSWVKQGRAAFPNLQIRCKLSSSCVTRLHFQVDASATVSPLATATDSMVLSTGLITVTNGVVPLFGLTFLPNSFIAFQRQPPVVAFGYSMPSIGLGLVQSDHSPDTTGVGLLVRASMTSGTLTGTLTATADANGQFWFPNLIVTVASAPLEPILRFCVEKDPAAATSSALAQYAAVVGRCVTSGTVTFVLPDSPAMLSLIPAVSSSGAPLIPSATALSPVFVASANASLIASPHISAVQVRVAVLNAANRVALPTVSALSQVELRATYASGVVSTTLQLDQRPLRYPSTPYATFADVVFADAVDNVPGAVSSEVQPPAQHLTHQLIITASDWLPWNPLYVGTIAYDLNATVGADVSPIVRVVVNIPVAAFVSMDWVGQLAQALRCPAEQIEIIRVNEAASGGDGDAVLWVKTSLDLMFVLPQVSDLVYLQPLELTQRLLRWDPVCTQFDLRIVHVFLREYDTPPFCDTLRLQDQILMAQYCYATDEDDANLCSCFTPTFTNLAPTCFSTTLVAELCTILDRCAISSETIVNGCAVYKSNLTVKYVLIAVYALCGALVVLMFVLWYQDVLGRCWRHTLGNRNRRDIEYEGLRYQRSKGEHVEVDANIF